MSKANPFLPLLVHANLHWVFVDYMKISDAQYILLNFNYFGQTVDDSVTLAVFWYGSHHLKYLL